MDTRDELLARILDATAAQRNVKINSDEQHAICTQEVLSPFRNLGTFTMNCNKFVT